MKNSRLGSIYIIVIHYIVAAGLGGLVYKMLGGMHPYWAMFVADAVATIYIWLLGLVYKNVSFYDPYWSVAPPVFLTLWGWGSGCLAWPGVLLLVAVWYWAIRLTGNWVYTFKGLMFEDWRYTKFRDECNAFVFHLINFWGLNMVPTIVVFLAMLPAFELLKCGGDVNWLTVVGFLVSVGAVSIQLISDNQAHKFRNEHPGEVCNVGLWKRGRHPNYFGEIMMWWGVWLMYVSVVGLSEYVWFILGPISVTVLFCVVSVPLMENRQLKNKPKYAEYKKHTRMFI